MASYLHKSDRKEKLWAIAHSFFNLHIILFRAILFIQGVYRCPSNNPVPVFRHCIKTR